MSLEERGAQFVQRYVSARRSQRAKLKSEAAALAGQVHRAGVDLCMSRATEFSPRIPVLFSISAQLALIAYGPGSDKLARFERDIRSRPASVAAYEALRKKL